MGHYAYNYLPGDLIGGQYRIIKRFEGGISEVYQCLDENTHKFVALKTLKPHFIDDQEHRRRFYEQVEVWIKIGKHPNVVWCMSLDLLDEKIPFMFLEWVSSENGRHPDLRGWMRGGKLSVRQVIEIMMDVCRGMIYANELYHHDLNSDLVHLDIKPDNILIAPGQVAKITDFGMAKVLNAQSRERTIIGKGTAAYMAPEQWTRDTSVNITTDVYSFGCMLYEMLTEKQPFEGSVYKLGQLHVNNDPDFSLIIPVLLPIVQRCMQKRQEDRYPSFKEVYESLHKIYIREFNAQPMTRAAQISFSVEDYTNRAETYMRLGNHEAALKDIEAALIIEPKNSYLIACKGLVFSALERHQEAIQLLEHAVKEVTDIAQIHFMMGITYEKSKDYLRALESLDKAIVLDSTHLAARYHRALTLAALQRTEEAIQDFTRIIRQRDDIGEFYLYRGVMYDIKGEYSAAINDFTRAIQVNSGLVEAYLERARVNLYKLQRRPEAIDDLRQYIDINPDEPEAYAVLGRLYTEIERFDEALRNFNLCLQIKPNQPLVYCERGYVYSQMRNYDKALEDFAKAEELAPKLGLPHSLRGIVFNQLGKHKEALESFSLASNLDPTDLTYIRGRTMVYAETEHYEMGLKEVTKLIIAAPDEKWAYYIRAYFLQHMRKFEEAQADLDHALEIDPLFQQARIGRGKLFIAMERYEEAFNDLEQARQRNPYNYNALVGLGQYHEKLGNHGDALKYYRQAAQLGLPEAGRAFNSLAGQLGLPKLSFDPFTIVISEFMNASSPGELQQAARRHPFMTDAQFIGMLQEAIIVTRDPRRVPMLRRNLIALKHLATHFQI